MKSTYSFDEHTEIYTFLTSDTAGADYELPKVMVDEILRYYSNIGGNMSVGQIASKLRMGLDMVKFVLKSMDVTHQTAPATQEDIDTHDLDELAETVVTTTRKAMFQAKVEKKIRKVEKEGYENWCALQSLQVDPFSQVLEKWKPPVYIPVKSEPVAENTTTDQELVIGCSDWHYGLIASESTLYNQKTWSIGQTVAAVQQYADKLVDHLKVNPYKKVNVCFLGDIAHSITGETDKGTKLHAYPLGQDQLDIAFTSLVDFIQRILSVHDNVHLYSVNGNHDSVSDYILMRMLSVYFKSDKRIGFSLTNKRHQLFKVHDNLFMISHGYAPFARDRLPPPGKGREAWINNLFMPKLGEHGTVKHKYFISGDLHHFESYEYTNVEGYIFPTLAGGCEHSDNSGYNSRQRQCCLRVDKSGVTQIVHFYLD